MLSFDARLRMSQTKEKYHADKVKAGRVSTSAGVPRPYARKNVLKAQLFSPKIVGTSVVVTPKHPFKKFGPGVYYEWYVTEPGNGTIEGVKVSAEEIFTHFIRKRK